MKFFKGIGLLAAAMSLLLLTACGSDGSREETVSILIAKTLRVHVGETKSLQVTRQKTDDFTVDVTPSSGSGCKKAGNDAVTCTPTAAGVYTVTVTASADSTKTSSATVTVPELEIFDGAAQTLYADEEESGEIVFNASGEWTATAIDDSTGAAPTWLTLSGVAGGLSANNAFDEMIQANAAATISGPSGNNSIKVTLQPNDSGADRTATITIATANGQAAATITQRSVAASEPDNPGTGEFPYSAPEGAVKYKYVNYDENAEGIMIVTHKDNNKKYRADIFFDDVQMVSIQDYTAGIDWTYYLGKWTSSQIDEPEGEAESFQPLPDRDKSILGIPCKAYKVIEKNAGSDVTTLWIGKGLIMASETEIYGVLVERMEALNYTLTVDDIAFTKTLDISWIQ